MTRLHHIEAAFVEWAQANDDIRAALVVGSRARTAHPADEWADLDIIMFAQNVERYQNATDWLEQFAPVWIALDGRTASGDPERLVLFEGGVQADFVFHSSDLLSRAPQMVESRNSPDIIPNGTRVLMDKEGVLARLPPPSQPPTPQPPDAQAFRQTLDRFWFNALYCARQLRRGELWTFQTGSSEMMCRLLQMVEWHARAVHGRDYDTWHGGRFIAEWTDPDVYADMHRTFAHLDTLDSEKALLARLDLFHRLARQVAAKLGLSYPDEREAQILACVEHMQETHAVSPDQVFWLEQQTVTIDDFPATGHILDIGGGGEGIIGQLKPGQVIAIDLSRRELEQASPGALKMVMDARDLQFLDGAFDTVTACFALMFMQEADQRRVLEEAYRVLAPGGRFLVWDVYLPARPKDLPAERRVVAFHLDVHLPGKSLQTGYGTLWPPQAHDLAYFLGLIHAAGLRVQVQQQQERIFFWELIKPELIGG